MAIQVVTFRLRGGTITPKLGGCNGLGVPGTFYMQTFGAERVVTDIDDAATTLIKSSDMQGQNIQFDGDHDDPNYRAVAYSQASYNSRGVLTTDGDLVFNANLTHVAEYVDDEDSI